jgi:hypothetical protein
MIVVAIDPGPIKTAYCIFKVPSIPAQDLPEILCFGIRENKDALRAFSVYDPNRIAIEMIASYGMAVGASVFDTCVWIGRFAQALDEFQEKTTFIFRKDVKMHLCGSMKAKDSNIRQAILDLYIAKYGEGVTKKGGMLYKASKDIWAAIGVGLTYINSQEKKWNPSQE